MKALIKVLISCSLIVVAVLAKADSELLRPFILASKSNGTIETVADATKLALVNNGFEIVGAYKPYNNALIFIITNDVMKQNAANSEYGGFGAAQRVALTKVGNEIQVSYTNPVYMANVYRMKSQLTSIKNKLASVLGGV